MLYQLHLHLVTSNMTGWVQSVKLQGLGTSSRSPSRYNFGIRLEWPRKNPQPRWSIPRPIFESGTFRIQDRNKRPSSLTPLNKHLNQKNYVLSQVSWTLWLCSAYQQKQCCSRFRRACIFKVWSLLFLSALCFGYVLVWSDNQLFCVVTYQLSG
jgi:hypothetical protein